MIVSRHRLLSGFLVIALTVSVLVHQAESSVVLRRPSLVQSLLQHAVAIGKRTLDFFFKPRLMTMPKSFLASARKFRFNALLNGSRRRNLARMRAMKRRPNNPPTSRRRRPVVTRHH